MFKRMKRGIGEFRQLVRATSAPEEPPVVYDPATMCMHFGGIDNSTTFVDAVGHTVREFRGQVHLSTAQKKFGTASALFDGYDDRVVLAAHTDWDFGVGNFTIDFWMNCTDVSGYNYMFDIGVDGSHLYFSSGVWSLLYNTTTVAVGNFTPIVGQWHHFAVTRSGDIWRMFADGSKIAESTKSNAFGIANQVFSIGNYGGGGNYGFKGYMDEFHVIKGDAFWTADFIVPSVPYSIA
jgi:hypothetical protein